VTRRIPVQRRSRERVDRILEAAAELLAEGGVSALTTRSLAAHTGIPVATIYRYFEDRDAILAAYLDRQMAEIEGAVTRALLSVERVTFRSLAEAAALAHMHHHQAHPEGIPVWFGGRMNRVVVERVLALDARLALSLRAAVRGAGMLEGAPDFIAELMVRLFDRMFEFVFLSDRSAAEQEEIVRSFVDMLSSYMERFATPAGRKGISADELVHALERVAAEDGGPLQEPAKGADAAAKR